MNIILYLLNYIQYQHKQICWLLNFICRYIPLKQWAFDDSHSPKYQKFKVDELPVIKTFIKQDWQFLLEYYQWKYGRPVKPVQRCNGRSIPKISSVPYAVPLTITSTITMAGTDNTSAKSADKPSLPVKWSPLPSGLPVLIAARPWLSRKTASSSAYTNVSIRNVLTISIILKKWIRRIWMKITAKTNIGSITSTVSSLWISLPWT